MTSITRLAGTPDAVTASFTYDSTFHRLLTATDPLTHVTSYTCDTCGSLLRRTDPLCRHVNHQHDAREAFPRSHR